MSVRQGDCLVLGDELTYIPAIKCASSTMRQALVKLGAREDNYLFHPDVLNNPVLFITRDPVARFISAYNHCHQWARLGTPTEVLDADRIHYHFLHQRWFLKDVQPDIWGRVEEMEELSQRLNMHLPRVNKGQHNAFAPHDCPQLRARIEEHYDDDYTLIEECQ